MTAEPTADDPAGDAAGGGRAPGQRASRRPSPERPARRPAATIDAPSQPALREAVGEAPREATGETGTPAPVTALAAPTTALTATTPRASVSASPAPSRAASTPPRSPALESPTSELREAPRPTAPMPTNIYRSRRPAVAILLVIPALGVGLLLVKALAMAAFGDTYDLVGVIASVCGLASLPFLVAGIYGLVSGAAHGAEHYGFRIWARPPLAYLIVGFAFVLASALTLR